MKRTSFRIHFSLIALTVLLLTANCAPMQPAPPLWGPDAYKTVLVLPIRMTIGTGRPPFTSEDTDLSNDMGGKMQEALAIAMRAKGYDVLAPLDSTERLMDEDDLSDAFGVLAAAHGYMDDSGKADWEEAMDGAALIGRKLGADLLILGRGRGEYHSGGENLVQGVLTGLLSKGREQYNAPPSFLTIDASFIDPAARRRIARFPSRQLPYEDDLLPLAKLMSRQMGRVPVRQNPESRSQEPGEVPKP
ncbi:MAG: hypothetical protein P1S46_09865 [bacterium]|nr:hypothetical protein [bacterium]MDT8396440.1 hypothetical protein [bacterium]